MDNRSVLGHTNPLPPQRTMSGSYAIQQQTLRRAPLPSRLNNVRSASQPVPPAHLIPGSSVNDARHATGLAGSQDNFYRSPEAISLDDEEEEREGGRREGEDTGEDMLDQRPAKRARTDGDGGARYGLTASHTPTVTDDPTDVAHEVTPGSPLPRLPKQRTVPVKHSVPRDARSRRDLAARKAHGLEPPAIATRLPAPRNVADFSPWNGHHPEDVLSETVIKSGYFEKPSGSSSTECHSAKSIVWPNLANKSNYNMGLQTLSYLFTQVMDKRQALGKCTAPSTFKPPPRVTVTDTKREAWLRDLANTEIPLRKQSRTIPHGIRGKLLMEQCLGKGISMPRAVWLAKCVGANELRAFRRKGVSGAAAASGESKWIREWTTHVEQFLEGVVASCGQPDWQTKMDYALKLATSFYSEHLLERDHYLDWIVSSFAASTMDRLPIWIILLQLYWKDITALAKRGRRLAEATLNFLHHLAQQGSKINSTLKMRLQKLIIVLAITKRGCLVLPRTWDKYRDLLAPGSLTMNSSPILESPAQNVTRRNERLVGPLCKTPQNTRCALLRMYAMLDAVTTDIDIDHIVATALSIVPNPANLVHALLDWAGSFYRAGVSRIHLAAQQILRLRDDRQNTDGAILEYLGNSNRTTIDIAKVHLVISELVRIDGFSTSRYLQWLITSGSSSGAKGSELATGLLAVIPTNALPPHLHNTKQTLLRRIGYPLDEETAVLKIEEDMIKTLSHPGPAFNASMERMGSLTCSAKSRISRRINAKARLWAKDHALSFQAFCHLRELTERSKDVLALSDLVEAGLMTDCMAFLSTVIDTLDMYAMSFAAVGRLSTLSMMAVERYRILRSQQPLNRTLIIALKSLLSLQRGQVDLLQLLENDLTICDQQSSMAVCSPASDNLVSMQASSLDSDEDIDAVFASGNTMDEQLTQRVFARIMQRATKHGIPATHAPSKLCAWWNQLRAVDVSGFEQLVGRYLRSSLSDISAAKSFPGVVSTLVASTCIELHTVLLAAKEHQSSQSALAALTMILSESVVNGALHDSEKFRYRVQQKRCRLGSAAQIVPLLVTAMDDPGFGHDLAAVSDLVRRYVANGHEQILTALTDVEKPSPPYIRNCGLLFMDLLHLRGSDAAMQRDINVRAIVALADPLSVKHCAAALQFFSKTGGFSGAEDDVELQKAILDAIAGRCEVWPQLLEGAGHHIMTAIYQSSRDKILTSTISLPIDGSASSDEETQRQLDVLDITHHAAKGDDYGQIVAALTDRVGALQMQLSSDATEHGSTPTTSAFLSSLNTVLHLSILYFTGPAASSPDSSDAFRQSQAQLLASLCTLLTHPNLQRHSRTLEYIYDVAGTLADALPDPALHSLSRSLLLGAPTRDPRLLSLLGDPTSGAGSSSTSSSPSTSSPAADAWLALVSHPPAPGSQQQRLLMKQSSSSSATAGAAAAAVSLSSSPLPARPPPPSAPLSTHSPAANAKVAAMRGGSVSAGVSELSGANNNNNAKVVPFPLRRWEIMSDATPTVGENDTSLSLGLFGARKV